MAEGVKTIIYPVKDLEAAKAVYGELLGVKPIADESYYVGYQVAGQDIGLDPNGHAQGLTGALAYWHVDDLEQRLQALLAAGAKVLQPVKDVGGGKLVASVLDADGNQIGLLQNPR
jgi:predicted enzyme related to lactoylglutathione lyase